MAAQASSAAQAKDLVQAATLAKRALPVSAAQAQQQAAELAAEVAAGGCSTTLPVLQPGALLPAWGELGVRPHLHISRSPVTTHVPPRAALPAQLAAWPRRPSPHWPACSMMRA